MTSSILLLRRRQKGVTLVELMVSMAIGLVLLAGLVALLVQQNTSHNELDKTTRQIENGRYAMQILQDEIQHAGFYGEFASTGAAPNPLPDPCATTAAALEAAIPLPIQGYDSSTLPAALPICLSSANYLPGTDILVIRRADTNTIPVASASAGQPYIQATYTSEVLRIGSSADYTLTKKDGTTLASLRKFLVHIYFVSPCSVPTGAGVPVVACRDSDDHIPTLKRLELTATGGATSFSLVPLAEGVENLQLDYGLDTVTPADGSPDSYTTNPGTTDWINVMAVRVNLLARNNEPSAGHADGKTYYLGGAGSVGPFHDRYKRHVFSELVRAINPSGRREN